jgi:hypothetical protein
VRYDATTSDPALGSIDIKNVLFFPLLFFATQNNPADPHPRPKSQGKPFQIFSQAVSQAAEAVRRPLDPTKQLVWLHAKRWERRLGVFWGVGA